MARANLSDQAMQRALAPRPATPAAQSAPGGPTSGTTLSKYTVLLDAESVDLYDGFITQARRLAGGKRITKSHLFRAILAVMADDTAVRDQILTEAARQKTA